MSFLNNNDNYIIKYLKIQSFSYFKNQELQDLS